MLAGCARSLRPLTSRYIPLFGCSVAGATGGPKCRAHVERRFAGCVAEIIGPSGVAPANAGGWNVIEMHCSLGTFGRLGDREKSCYHVIWAMLVQHFLCLLK